MIGDSAEGESSGGRRLLWTCRVALLWFAIVGGYEYFEIREGR